MVHDVVIVGARCAGAALATYLARSGAKVLVVEAAKLPSDLRMSTHFVHPPGIDVLDELGVGERVRREAPPSHRFRFSVDGHQVNARHPEGRAGYCIRRLKLDAWLQQAAVDAGAELRDETAAVDLLRDDGRVTGVVVRGPRGTQEIRAGLVVGADGRNSKIARLTGVEEYLTADMTRGGYWQYWPVPRVFRDPGFGYDALIAHEGDGLRYVFQADGDLLLLVAAPPADEARSWGNQHFERTIEYLRASPETAPLVDSGRPSYEGGGILKARFFLRRAAGPGFALVGDAGHFKDFVTGHGITDALLGALRLSQAIAEGGDAALVRYWRERDVHALPLHFDAIRLGEVGFNDALTRVVMKNVGRSPELSARFALVNDRKISPFDAIGPLRMASWVLKELVFGRFAPLGSFLRTGRRMAEAQRELALRRRLVDELGAAGIRALPAPTAGTSSAVPRLAA
jgi:flavin-dependent dehydrogenase